MTKYYIAALAIATALNIFYTVYSYNEVNKWRQSVDSRIENTVERVNHVEDRVNSIDNTELHKQIKEVHSQVNAKIDNKLVDQINSRMLETMMSLEARVYELELKDIEKKLRESAKK